MKKRTYASQRVKIGKSFFVPVLLKVVATNPDGSPRWLEIAGDDETQDIANGSREFYLVWGSELLAGRSKQNGKGKPVPAPTGTATAVVDGEAMAVEELAEAPAKDEV